MPGPRLENTVFCAKEFSSFRNNLDSNASLLIISRSQLTLLESNVVALKRIRAGLGHQRQHLRTQVSYSSLKCRVATTHYTRNT
jgi:hypothetical protein